MVIDVGEESPNVPNTTVILETFREPLWENDKRFTVLQGGGGSGKSCAVCQYLCYLFLNYDDIIIAVIRESMPILKKTVYMGDPSIVRTLRDWNVPVDDWWNKTDTTITNPFNKSEIRFIGLDSSEKIKSQNWNYCWIEEATELTLEKWSQCNTRMRRPNKHGPDRMIISYNPINIYNWVIQQFVVNPSPYIKENTFVHFSNFLDNPFLPKEAIISMMDTAERDENYYWTYVIGKPGIPVGQIYTNFKFTPREGLYDESLDGGEPIEVIPPWPKELDNVEPYYGIDFGYVDPMVVVEVKEYEGKYYVRNLFYETGYTTNQLIDELRKFGIGSNVMLYCDSAEQDRIALLGQEGFCPNDSSKNIHAGITFLKGLDIVVDSTGKNGEIARNEIQGYMWDKDKDDPRILLDEPAKKQQDHFCLDGDTLITTIHGLVPIKDITVGEMVLTRKGYKKVIDWAMTNPQAEVWELQTERGLNLICTKNHKIWSENRNAFIPSDALRYGDYLLALNQSYTMGLFGSDTPIQNINLTEGIGSTVNYGFTDTSGRKPTGQSQKDVTSTIKTATPTIMTYPTSNVCQSENISQNIPSQTKDAQCLVKGCRETAKHRRNAENGTLLTRVINGIKNTLNLSYKRKNTSVSSVEQPSSQKSVSTDSVQTNVGLNGDATLDSMMLIASANTAGELSASTNIPIQDVVQPVALQRCVGIDGKRPVYNITVEDEHEYFANGILVSNCDAIRYAIFTHHLRNVEFSTVPLDMGDGKGNKSSSDILKEMSKLMSKF